MARIAIIGGGAFGTAMACVVRRSGHDTVVWAREPEVVESIERDGANPHFLSGVALMPGIRACAELAMAVGDADAVLMAVPAQHVRSIAGELRPALRRGMPVVSCSKGIESGSCALMPEVLAEMLPDAVVGMLSGPSFAREIAVDKPCGVMLACADWSTGESLARIVSNPNFCVHLSDDLVGVALAGAMKNVMSIVSGIAHGRGLGENARATIITLGLLESARLGMAKGAKQQTFLGLAGAGDFMLTAQSLQSRNTSLGVEIAKGRRVSDVLAGRKEVTEGAHSVSAVAMLASQLHVDMPITRALDSVLSHGVDLEGAIANLMRHLPPLCRAG